jgi:hypothetical protein
MTYEYNNSRIEITSYEEYLHPEYEEKYTFFAIKVEDEQLVGMYITEEEAKQAAEDFIDEELPYL